MKTVLVDSRIIAPRYPHTYTIIDPETDVINSGPDELVDPVVFEIGEDFGAYFVDLDYYTSGVVVDILHDDNGCLVIADIVHNV
jgi:hypothetical protein